MATSKNGPKTLVVDASVAVKWFLPEPDAEPAVAMLRGSHRLIAPDLLWIEVASVLWKVARRGSLSADEAQRMIADAAAFPVEIVESVSLLPDALRIATAADRTVYDSLYVALAARDSAVMVTADNRLVNALANTGWADSVRRLDDA
jgi:predicted nucleic acid-binding protein